MNSNKSTTTPLIKQYLDIKSQFPETLLLFQVGDFYELFFDDAKKASEFLGIALTKRGIDANGDPIPLCGVPIHVLDHYLAKLVRGNFKVAICDQLETPTPGKVVKRGITQVLTSGTLTDIRLLDDKSASYLCTFFATNESWILIFAELLTGQLFVTKLQKNDNFFLLAELNRFMPDEIILPEVKLAKEQAVFLAQNGYNITWQNFNANFVDIFDQTTVWLNNQFKDVKEILADKSNSFLFAFSLLYSFLKKNNERGLLELKQLVIYKPDEFLMLDAATQRNLELVKNCHDNSSKHTLFSVIDRALTPMGSRTLKKWILRPLIDQSQIEQRLDVVSLIKDNNILKTQLFEILKNIGDLERITGRIALKRAQRADYIALLKALKLVPDLKNLILNYSAPLLNLISSKILNFDHLDNMLTNSLETDFSNSYLIKNGYNSELDKLRTLIDNSAQEIIKLEKKEQTRTNINSLKIRYNGPYGYSIEVTKANLHLIPDDYLRLQTLVNRERFTTEELKVLENAINRANTQTGIFEKEIFENIKFEVEKYLPSLRKLAQSIAYLDALTALADVAYVYSYVKPSFNSDRNIVIKSGRHPVIEQNLKNKFIPNDTQLTDQESLWIITGPNMGGKSTYLRQIAQICLLAQIGSFVPADSAELFIVDRIFTRIGAIDNVAQGKSTFLIEMEETAVICNYATANSLVILDEVGRGTSTYDGLAIAQSVIEYIYTHVTARCLFATHYHELTLLTKKFPAIVAYYAASAKTETGIVLLHKILSGVAQGSFGLEVAKLAKVPKIVTDRAEEIIQNYNIHPLTYKNANIS